MARYSMQSLRVDNVRKNFGTTKVLRGISLDISKTEFVALLGPSGCGKTTLLRIIAGLERQDAGSVDIAGRCVDDLGPAERDIALVFQSYALYPHLTVAQNIAVPLVMRRLSAVQRLPGLSRLSGYARTQRRDIARDVAQIAESMEIGHLLDRKPGQLSGGQKQRVAVARALVRKPSILLMDEPLSNLDAKLRVQMRQEIVGMHRRHGATTVYVTHDQTEAMTMADRIAVILNGELQQIGTPAEIYKQPASIDVAEFVGSPKINILPCTLNTHGLTLLGTAHAGTAGLAGASAAFIGIRPEHVTVDVEGEGPTVRCKIASLEYLGSEALIQARVGDSGEEICLRTDIDVFERAKQSDTLKVRFSARNMLLFGQDRRRIDWSAAQGTA
ncbi:MAG: ABC transporter ATP-binding protein [Reyranella sp.]|nr:ABC transporter ATP-binding protein [Reyranella sp.]MDP3161222.1 ABC transporter ATP-binding protein [Reyranella sp.]